MRKVKVNYKNAAGQDLMVDDAFLCEIPPVGRILIIVKAYFEVIRVIEDYATNEVEIIVQDAGKSFWFISAKAGGYTINMGYVSNVEKPLNNDLLCDIIATNNQVSRDRVLIEFIFEFKTEADYLNFWKKS